MATVRDYLSELRLPFVTATLITALVGAAWPGPGGVPPWPRIILVVFGAVLAHLAANVLNDYFDHRSGADAANTAFIPGLSGGSRLIQKGRLRPAQVLALGVLLLGVAAGCGALALLWGGPSVAVFAAAGGLLAVGYTAPPLRLVHRGLGEPAIFLAFGPLLGAGSWAATHGGGIAPPAVWLLTSVLGLWVTMILLANELPDRAGDAAVGKATWVVRLGEKIAARLYGALYGTSLLLLVFAVITGLLSPWFLFGVVPAPLAWRNARLLMVGDDRSPLSLAPACMGTVQAHLVGGALILAAVFAG